MTISEEEREETPSSEQEEAGGEDAEKSFYERFELSDTVLGRGAFSTVRVCVDRGIMDEAAIVTGAGEKYAVKIVDVSTERQSINDAAKLKKETLREVYLLNLTRGHENIVNLRQFYKARLYYFLVFDMAPHGQLFDELTRLVRFSEKRTKRLMRQIVDGLQFLHDRLIIHRDMKLENILLMSPERICITDFGFATRLSNQSELLKDFLGSPSYLAPELLHCQFYPESSGYGIPIDMWACGVMMFAMLSGMFPFSHRNQMRMLRMIQEGVYSFRPDLWSNISDEAKDLIKNLLLTNPIDRLTAIECLDHPWLRVGERVATMNAQHRFKAAITDVRFFVRLKRMRELNMQINRQKFASNPYSDMQVRQLGDQLCFEIYGHWINTYESKSRDLLFANRPLPHIDKKDTVRRLFTHL